MATPEKYIDYKKHIGMQVNIKTFYSSRRIKGELVAVYSDVLCIQGVTLWGVYAKDIIDFELVQPCLFKEVQPK